MRKYLITTCLLFSIYLPTFSQNSMVIDLRSKRDDLKSVMPSLKGSAKVDCLNAIVDIYQILDEADQMQIDSATPYAKQAFNEAKRIGYKRGLGYSYLKLSYCEILMAIPRDSKFEPGSLADIETKIKQSMQIGEAIKDNAMIGSGYYLLSRLQRMMTMKEQWIDFLKKSITFFEKAEANQSSGIYKEMSFNDCNSCTGYEYRLGLLYEELGLSQKDPIVVVEKMNKAINYYQKVGGKSGIGFTYMGLGNSLSLKIDVETAVKYYKKAIPYFQEAQNENGEFNAYIALCTSYFDLGDFENGLEYSKKCVLMAEKLAKNKATGNGVNPQLHQAYYWMGKFYSIANDYPTAFAFMRKARYYWPDNLLWAATMAEFHRLNGNYDSSMYYINNIGNRRNKVLITLSSLHISMHQYDSALILINGITNIVTENNNLVNLGRLYANAAKAYYGKNDYANALTNARISFILNKKTSRNLELIDNCQLLSDIFNKLSKNDSAYIYQKQYTTLKDSLLNRQFLIRLNDYKKEAEDAKRIGQINLLQKNSILKEKELLEQILLKKKNEAQLALLSNNNEIKDQQLQIKDQSLKEQNLLKEQSQAQLTLSDKENKLKDQRLKQQATIRNEAVSKRRLLFILSLF